MSGISRRGFLGGALAGIAAARGATEAHAAEEGAAAPAAKTVGPKSADEVDIAFDCNDEAQALVVTGEVSALEVLRRQCGQTGAKLGCGAGTCGACTVLVDGRTTVTCLLPATALHKTAVTTVEGLSRGSVLPADMHAMQRAFMANDALQCGYCTPGFIVEAADFHDRWREANGTTEPSRDDIAGALAGHLCRCGAYQAIYNAVAAACRGEFDDPEVTYARVDAPEKVTGAAEYTVDVQLDGQLEGRIYRSPVAHAVLTDLDTAAAETLDGVQAVFRIVPNGGLIRFAGQELAAVAATDPAIAARALQLIEPSFDELPSVITLEAARAPGAVVIYPDKRNRNTAPSAAEGPVLAAEWDGNLRGPFSSSLLGKPRKGRKGVDDAAKNGFVASGTWNTQVQCHTALEPHAAVAWWKSDDDVEVWASTQSCVDLAEDIAQRFKVHKEGVVVHCPYVGGGFGAKVGLQMEALVAIELSRMAGVPVRIALTREGELTSGGTRPGQRIDIALGMSNGTLMGMSHQATTDSGVSVGNVTGMLSRLMYDTPRKDLDDFDIVTNGPPGKPFRGPGGPPTYFALEGAVDQIAHDAGEDPIELRRRWDPNAQRQALFDWIETLDVWKERGPVGADTGRFRRGVGLASGAWFHFFDPGAQLEVEVSADGVVARTASQDMGNGSKSLVAAILAGHLDVAAQDIRVEFGDSRAVYGPLAGGSRVTSSLGPCAEHAGEQLTDALADLASTRGMAADSPLVDLLTGAKPIRVVGRRKRDDKAAFLPFAIQHLKIGRVLPGVVNVSEVEVDTRLGRVSVREAWVGVGVGRIFCEPVARSQMEGAVVQGISYTLFEERRLDPTNGRLLTHNLDDYRIAGIGDVPPIHVHFHEGGFEHVRGGGIGLAEIGTVAVSGSIGNAVFHATGTRPYTLPLTPSTVLGGSA